MISDIYDNARALSPIVRAIKRKNARHLQSALQATGIDVDLRYAHEIINYYLGVNSSYTKGWIRNNINDDFVIFEEVYAVDAEVYTSHTRKLSLHTGFDGESTRIRLVWYDTGFPVSYTVFDDYDDNENDSCTVEFSITVMSYNLPSFDLNKFLKHVTQLNT